MENLFNKYSQFNQSANELYHLLYSDFSQKATEFRRKDNENLYQVQKAKYLVRLKQGLEELASRLIGECENNSLKDKLRFGLPARIEIFLREFMQKTEAL